MVKLSPARMIVWIVFAIFIIPLLIIARHTIAMADDDFFNHYVVEYIAFRAANEPGHFPSAESKKCAYKENEVQLAKWIERMNSAHWRLSSGQSSVLNEQRVGILSEIGFPWVECHDLGWEKTFNELEAFHEQEGHSDVPFRNGSLGRWVGHQRASHKAYESGEPSTLTFGKIAKLESIGFKWEIDGKSKWNAKFEQLSSFNDINDNCDVPSTHQDTALANWVKQQRKNYKTKCNGKKTSITDEQIEQLKNLGFQWKINRRRSGA